MSKRKQINQARFTHIKNLLSEEGATISSAARQAKASWDTVRNISKVNSFAEYRGADVVSKTPGAVWPPVNLVAQLKERKAQMNKHFDAVIAALEK